MQVTIIVLSCALLAHTSSLCAQDTMLSRAAGKVPAQPRNHRTDGGSTDDGSDLWNNGRPNGYTGLSSAVQEVFGFRRTLLFDFVVSDGETWRVEGLRWLHIWNTAQPPVGTGLEIRFYDDAGNRPGVPITSIREQLHYDEIATGNVWFSRLEAQSIATFASQSLSPGRYWTDMTIVGPENNFWLTSDVLDNPVWVDYADFGGLQPGINVFGVDYDVNGTLTGSWFGGNYTLELAGQCPGQLTTTWNGANPDQRQALIFGRSQGQWRIPENYPCGGTVLGLWVTLRIVTPPGIFSTRDGSGSFTGSIGPNSCGYFLQLIEVGSCNTSNVANIP